MLLRQRGIEAAGAFLANGADPLTPRKPDFAELRVKQFEASHAARRGRTTLPLCPWDLPLPWFLATLTMPDGLALGRTLDGGVLLETADGSRCHITPRGRYREVVEDGPANLCDHFVQVHRQWQDAYRVSWNRLDLTVTRKAHTVAGVGPQVWRTRSPGWASHALGGEEV